MGYREIEVGRESARSLLGGVLTCLLVGATILEAQVPTQRQPSTGDVVKAISPTAVTIKTPTGSGSGVIVGATGTIVTNLHVVRGDSSASVTLANGDVYDDVQVVDVDARKDLVVLKIKAFGLPTARLGNSDDVAVGDSVFVLGSPRGLQNTLSSGLVSAMRDSGEGYRLIQTTAPASPGSSGGGLFTSSGELVGIISSKMPTAENVNFALPINYVRGILGTEATLSLAELSKRYPASPAADPPVREVTATTTQAGRERISKALKDSGLEIKAEGDLWKTDFKGEKADVVAVTIFQYEDLVVIQSAVIARMPLTAEQMAGALRRTFEGDLVKLGLLKDELVATAEAEIRTLDGPLVKRLIEAVALLADTEYGEIGASLASYSPLQGPARMSNPQVLNLNRGAASLQYDGRVWRRDGDAALVAFRNEAGDAFFRVLAERGEIPMTSLENLALTNAKKLDTNARVARRGSRQVNGQNVVVLELEAKAEGVPLKFYGHYISGKMGTIQILGWTTPNLYDEYRSLFESLVAGLIIK